MKRVWLRATVLALAVVGAVAGLTVYYSTEGVPRCLVSGTGTWQPPSDSRTHRYEVVILDGSACFFDMDQQQRLVGALPLAQAQLLSAAVPTASDRLSVTRYRARSPVRDAPRIARGSHDRPPNEARALRHALQGLYLEPALRAGPAESRALARAGPPRALGARRAEQRRAHLRRERATRQAASAGWKTFVSRNRSPATRTHVRVRAVASARSCTVRTVVSSTSATRGTSSTPARARSWPISKRSTIRASQLEVDWVRGKAVFPSPPLDSSACLKRRCRRRFRPRPAPSGNSSRRR